jgi:hypothetical protein
MNEGRRPTLGERIDSLPRRNFLLATLVLLAVVVSSVVTLTTYGFRVYRWAIRPHPSWQTTESNVIASLSAGYSLEIFKSHLGVPLLVRRAGPLIEDTFKRRGYWVQTVSDPGGTVQMFAVTVCDDSFHPHFESQVGPSLTLGVSTLASVGRQLKFFRPESDYQLSGATANSFFYEVEYGGNPGNYKNWAWGIDDACPSWPNEQERFYKQGLFAGFGNIFRPRVAVSAPRIQRFRRAAVINTYAETAPTVRIKAIEKRRIQIGIDRIRVRATSPNYYPPFNP